jgi:hypothetical protein
MMRAALKRSYKQASKSPFSLRFYARSFDYNHSTRAIGVSTACRCCLRPLILTRPKLQRDFLGGSA